MERMPPIPHGEWMRPDRVAARERYDQWLKEYIKPKPWQSFKLALLIVISSRPAFLALCLLWAVVTAPAGLPWPYHFVMGGLCGGWMRSMDGSYRNISLGWRWHFRMSRKGQWLLRVAHRERTPPWLHDAIERLVYGNDR